MQLCEQGAVRFYTFTSFPNGGGSGDGALSVTTAWVALASDAGVIVVVAAGAVIGVAVQAASRPQHSTPAHNCRPAIAPTRAASMRKTRAHISQRHANDLYQIGRRCSAAHGRNTPPPNPEALGKQCKRSCIRSAFNWQRRKAQMQRAIRRPARQFGACRPWRNFYGKTCANCGSGHSQHHAQDGNRELPGGLNQNHRHYCAEVKHTG